MLGRRGSQLSLTMVSVQPAKVLRTAGWVSSTSTSAHCDDGSQLLDRY